MKKQGVGTSAVVILLTFICVLLGVRAYVPRHKIVLVFEQILSAFETGVVVAILVVGVAALVSLGAGCFFVFTKGVFWYTDTRIHKALAMKAERDATLVLTAVPTGHTLFASEVLKGPSIVHKPVSLSPGRVNGTEIKYTAEENTRWAFWQQMHSTANKGTVQELPVQRPEYPESVNLMDLLPNGSSSFNNVVLGLHINEDGTQETVTDSMQNLVHVAVGGASGWGKSVCLRSLAYQMETCNDENVKLCFLDSENLTFTAFNSSKRILYPIADDDTTAMAIVSELAAEMGRRKVLFAKYPTVEKLSDFNHLSDEPLPYIMLFADEATSLFKSNKRLEQAFSLQILRARKFGIMAILGGQSWKSDVMDTTMRGQFSSTIHFHARDKSSSNVLLGSGVAAEITRPGFAYAILPGRPMIDFLSPMISKQTAMRELGSEPVLVEMPDPLEKDESLVKPTERQEKILNLWDAGTYTGDLPAIVGRIAKEVYTDNGGKQREQVRKTLSKFDRISENT